MKNYAFPQQLLPHLRGHFRTVPATGPTVPVQRATELPVKLLGDLAQLCRVESQYARDVAEYTHLKWIKADLERRIRKAAGVK
jgi:hypothetical protein